MATAGIAPQDVKYVVVKGGDLDGKWYPKEWLRDTMASKTAARFVPTGEVKSRSFTIMVKDPVIGEMPTVAFEYGYEYREVIQGRVEDPRSRFVCPICPVEDLADGRRRVVVYKRKDWETHCAWHVSEEGDEDPRKFAHEGSVVEYAGSKGLENLDKIGDGEVVGTAGIAPDGSFIGGEGISSTAGINIPAGTPGPEPTTPPGVQPSPVDHVSGLAEQLGISVTELRNRLEAASAPAPTPVEVDPIAAAADHLGISPEDALERLTTPVESAVVDGDPVPGSGAEKAQEESGSQTPPEEQKPEEGQQGSGGGKSEAPPA